METKQEDEFILFQIPSKMKKKDYNLLYSLHKEQR